MLTLLASLLFTPPAAALRAAGVLERNCAACHGKDSAGEGGIDFIDDLAHVRVSGLITPGNAATSVLIKKVREANPDLRMPLGADPLTAADDAALAAWIDGGALLDDSPETGAPSLLAPLRVAVLDAERLDRGQARKARYLTLCHFGADGTTSPLAERYRNSLSQTLNSLSWNPRIARPQVIDDKGCVLRLSLDDYQLAVAAWEKLTAEYPYKFNDPDGLQTRLATATGGAQSLLRADWLITTASRPPHYHELLGIPDKLGDLATLLGIDLDAQLLRSRPADRRVWRAGFTRSGVSNFNRVVDRFATRYGSFWRSYDFGASGGVKNILTRPLGPAPLLGSIGATGEQLGFAPDGGEVIFNLPNGLQGYMLVNAKGDRLDVGPANIVFNRERGEVITNGISCMSCHAEGIIPKADEVSSYLAGPGGEDLSPQALALAHGLYAEADDFRAVVDRDRARFTAAVGQAAMTPGARANELLTLFDLYQKPVDLLAAAKEFGFPDTRTATLRLNRLPPRLRQVIAPLLSSLSLPRDAFEASFAAVADELLAQPETLEVAYRDAEVRFAIGATAQDFAFDVADDAAVEDVSLAMTFQGARGCRLRARLAAPAGQTSAAVELSPAWTGTTVQSATATLQRELAGIIGSRSGGRWRLSLQSLDGCQGATVALRKLALTIHGH